MNCVYNRVLLATGVAAVLLIPLSDSGAASIDGEGQQAGKPPASAPPRTTPQRDRLHDQAMQKDRLKDQDRDQLRDKDQLRDRDALQSGEQVYGWQLMTEAERNTYREKMRSLHTEQEREQFRETHHQQMLERAKAQGVTLPPEPRPQKDR